MLACTLLFYGFAVEDAFSFEMPLHFLICQSSAAVGRAQFGCSLEADLLHVLLLVKRPELICRIKIIQDKNGQSLQQRTVS